MSPGRFERLRLGILACIACRVPSDDEPRESRPYRCDPEHRGRVRIAWMPDDRPGFWMYHCHILEHHAGGMMANFAVVRPGESAMEMDPAHSCHI